MKTHAAKFETFFSAKEIPKNPENGELIKWGKIFAMNGLAPKYGKKSSSGNLSFRTKNGMVITRSGSDLENLRENELVEVNACDEEKFSVHAKGLFVPSSESFEHFEIYRARPEINAVFHGHSQEILLAAKKLRITETINPVPYGTIENLCEVMNVLGKNDFLVMKNHGFLSLGKTIDECGEKALWFQKKAMEVKTK
ncbi:MAG: class II aldolase/adducin family protein [Candidatus Diapherotrites archaeon]|nr:class II aldolase/adducin family protein [Candidatus Diapherotrites archaeon]